MTETMRSRCCRFSIPPAAGNVAQLCCATQLMMFRGATFPTVKIRLNQTAAQAHQVQRTVAKSRDPCSAGGLNLAFAILSVKT
jgi:hypothetical protein